jgi:hypothetical protein
MIPLKIHQEPWIKDVTAITDVSYDLSSTSDISQVTTTEEVLMLHHYVNTEYNANDPVILSSSSYPFPSTPLSKPPYPNQRRQMNLHDISAYNLIQAHVYELETEAVPDDTITDDSSVDEVDPEPPNILLYKEE